MEGRRPKRDLTYVRRETGGEGGRGGGHRLSHPHLADLEEKKEGGESPGQGKEKTPPFLTLRSAAKKGGVGEKKKKGDRREERANGVFVGRAFLFCLSVFHPSEGRKRKRGSVSRKEKKEEKKGGRCDRRSAFLSHLVCGPQSGHGGNGGGRKKETAVKKKKRGRGESRAKGRLFVLLFYSHAHAEKGEEKEGLREREREEEGGIALWRSTERGKKI